MTYLRSHATYRHYFMRQRGLDHVLVFCHDGARSFLQRPESLALVRNMIGVVGFKVLADIPGSETNNETWLSEQAAIGERQDIVAFWALPEGPLRDIAAGGKITAPALSHRPYLFHFRGYVWDDENYSHGIRQALYRQYAADASVLVRNAHTSQAEYLAEMQQSKFCLYPDGWLPWSHRPSYLLFARCVPVFVMDGSQPPHDDLIDGDLLAAPVATGRARGRTKQILASIPQSEVGSCWVTCRTTGDSCCCSDPHNAATRLVYCCGRWRSAYLASARLHTCFGKLESLQVSVLRLLVVHLRLMHLAIWRWFCTFYMLYN